MRWDRASTWAVTLVGAAAAATVAATLLGIGGLPAPTPTGSPPATVAVPDRSVPRLAPATAPVRVGVPPRRSPAADPLGAADPLVAMPVSRSLAVPPVARPLARPKLPVPLLAPTPPPKHRPHRSANRHRLDATVHDAAGRAPVLHGAPLAVGTRRAARNTAAHRPRRIAGALPHPLRPPGARRPHRDADSSPRHAARGSATMELAPGR